MRSKSSRRQQGFSLVEIMVGLVIGMAGTIIMLQMLSNSDAAKRTSGGANDAQMNGALALYSLEREIRASGYGINSYALLGCTVSYTTSVDGASVKIPLAPVVINPPTAQVPDGDPNTDTLLVVYGNSQGSAEGDPLISNSTSGSYPVSTASSYKVGDVLIAQTAARPSPCALTSDRVINVPSGSSIISVSPGVSGLPVGSIIFNLGSAPVARAYAVRNGNLTVCDYTAYDCSKFSYAYPLNSTVWVPIAGNIVSLRAQYGRDAANLTAPMVGVVSTYNQNTPGTTADTSGLSVMCSWARTLSVRLAVVARNAAYNKDNVTTALPTWSGTTVDSTNAPTNPQSVPLQLDGDGKWQHYRYKTLETTVPLRNAIWQGGQANYQGGTSGC